VPAWRCVHAAAVLLCSYAGGAQVGALHRVIRSVTCLPTMCGILFVHAVTQLPQLELSVVMQWLLV
jgi:hypothetical protein